MPYTTEYKYGTVGGGSQNQAQAKPAISYHLNIASHGTEYRINYKLPGYKSVDIICTENDCKHAVSLLKDLGLEAFIGYVTRVLPREKAERQIRRKEKELKKAQDAFNELIKKEAEKRATP